MLTNRIRATLVVLAASAGLAGCTSLGPYGGVGVGIGNQYGYGGQYGQYGYNGYGYDPYYAGYGSGYGYNPYGWYNGFYYPGAGYWVYDPYGTRHPITTDQSSYWRNILAKLREERGLTATAAAKENFSGFRARAKAGATIPGVDLDAQAQADQGSLRQISAARRQAISERQQAARAERAQTQTARAQVRSERAQVRAERQEARQSASQDRSESTPTRRRPRN